MNKKVLIILILIVLISGAISFSLLTRGQSWLDDFASYIMQAKSISTRTMDDFVRRNAFTVNQSSYPPGPVAYPWGFPLLLVPVYAIFGINVLAFQLVNTLFYTLFLIVFFALARTRLTDAESLIVVSALAVNPAMLLAHAQILSDIPFLFFSTLGIFLIDRFFRGTRPDAGRQGKPSLSIALAIGIAVFAANFIRTNGILLFIPLATVQGIRLWPQRRDKANLQIQLKSALMPYLTFGLLFAIQTLIFPDGQESYLSHFSMFSFQRLWENFLYYLFLPSLTFDQIPGGVIIYPILLPFVIVSILSHRSRDLPIHNYGLATVALFSLWPERQGLRFIYPILSFLFLFSFDGMKLAIAWIKTDWQQSAKAVLLSFWIALVVVSFGISLISARDNLAANRAINGPLDPVSAQMFEFIREKTPSESVIIFFKPRAMRLFTDRDSFMTDRCEDIPKGDYLALNEKVGNNGQVPPEEVLSCNSSVKLDEVFNNRRFTIYKVGK